MAKQIEVKKVGKVDVAATTPSRKTGGERMINRTITVPPSLDEQVAKYAFSVSSASKRVGVSEMYRMMAEHCLKHKVFGEIKE